MSYAQDFEKALEIGRPPNISALFPNSRALIVSGKVIDRAMLAKGKAMTMAANGRSHIVIRGALRAAQKARAAIIIEIARSEGGASAYCATNYWNIARQVDAICNELAITVPVAIHADHYGIKKKDDLPFARTEIPSIFDAGITSIAIDASHMPDDENLLANIDLARFVPTWAGYETEVGEIKGKLGLSTPEEALFIIQGLNAHNIFPDWIALNNGTTHGIEASAQGINVELTAEIHDALAGYGLSGAQHGTSGNNSDRLRDIAARTRTTHGIEASAQGINVELTAEIHDALAGYGLSGAQHGTSGNNSDRLRDIAARTRTTKANVATALQMISWGLEVNDYGNAIQDANGEFIKIQGEGVTEELWQEMREYAADHGWQGGNYKKLNIVFENKIMGQPAHVRERMTRRVEDFVYTMLVEVFNAGDSARHGVEAILEAGSFDLGPKTGRIDPPEEWTEEKIRERAAAMDTDKGPHGDFDD